jgi:hypothetical protein
MLNYKLEQQGTGHLLTVVKGWIKLGKRFFSQFYQSINPLGELRRLLHSKGLDKNN